MSCKEFIVVDNFYDNPLNVRQLARIAEYAPKGQYSQNFAGIESCMSFYTEAVITKIKAAVGEDIVVDPSCNAFGRFRLAYGEDRRRTQVHSDNTDWTAVIYLTPDEYCRGGTYFYRHKETGLASPPTDAQLKALGLTRGQFNNEVVMRDTLDPEKWEITARCEMKFNRCVILKGRDYFHGSDQLFGDSFENGRLTQNFFFNRRSLT